MGTLLRVLLAEDHAVLRRVLRQCIEEDARIYLVGEARNGAEAVRMAVELKPVVVVMDLEMPELDGIEASERILGFAPETKILLLSLGASQSDVSRAFRTGVRGFLLKNATNLPLVESIHEVAQGRYVFAASIPKAG